MPLEETLSKTMFEFVDVVGVGYGLVAVVGVTLMLVRLCLGGSPSGSRGCDLDLIISTRN